MSTLQAGPADGTLSLHTGVEGRAAKMGHDLTIVLSDWQATATVEDGAPTALELRAVLSSLDPVKGEGGLKPLSDKDRASIRDNALETLRAGQHPEVVFTSSAVRPSASGYTVQGQLSIGGVERPAELELAVSDAGERLALSAQVPVLQTEHGIKPYSAMMGGLRVRDRVEVRVEATVPRP